MCVGEEVGRGFELTTFNPFLGVSTSLCLFFCKLQCNVVKFFQHLPVPTIIKIPDPTLSSPSSQRPSTSLLVGSCPPALSCHLHLTGYLTTELLTHQWPCNELGKNQSYGLNNSSGVKKKNNGKLNCNFTYMHSVVNCPLVWIMVFSKV